MNEAAVNPPRCGKCSGRLVALPSGSLACTEPECVGWVRALSRECAAADGASLMHAMIGACPAIGAAYGSTGNDQPSRARAFSTDRRAGLQLEAQHRAPECSRCGSGLTIGRCLACERDRAEWGRIERAAAGKGDDGIGWKGLAIACGLWAAFVVVLAFAIERVVA